MTFLKNALRTLPLLALMAVTATSCEPDYDEYYVRYTVGINPGDEVAIKYTDLFNRQPEITGVKDESTVEAIVGPAYGGFPATVTATVNGGQAPAYLRIEISENGAPYQVKAEQSGVTSLTWKIPLDEEK